MSRTTQVVIPIALLIIGVVAGYYTSYAYYQPYQTQLQNDFANVKNDLLETEATLSAIRSNYDNSQASLAALDDKLQSLLKPSIMVLSYPTHVTVGRDFIVAWNVTGGIPGVITQTEIHMVNASNPGEDVVISQIFSGLTPQRFSATIVAPNTTGTFTFHIHAVVDDNDIFTDDKNVLVTVSQNFDILLNHPYKSMSIVRGGKVTVMVNVSWLGNFSTPVNLSIADLPLGVTTTLNQTQIVRSANNNTNASFTLNVQTNAIVGTYPISVAGASDSTTEADAMMVTITDPNREVTIEIRSNAFNPDTIAVVQGTIVTWINNDAVPHRVEFTSGYIDSGYLDVADYYSYMFGSIGTFNYQDSSYPNMTGAVIVVANP